MTKTKQNSWTSVVKVLLLLLVILQGISSATALGVRPARTEILFEGTPSYTGSFWVVNNNHADSIVRVTVEGELGQFITIANPELRFRADIDALPVDFTISTIPEGTTTADILVEETLSGSNENFISSRIIIKHKVIVLGPYPDKYVETKLNFHDREGFFELVSEVTNLGKEDIDRIQTTFYVNDKKEKQQELATETIGLKKKENKLLTASLHKDLLAERGEFEITALTIFDGKQVEMVKKLLIGKPEVKVKYFDKYFVADQVNPYSIDLLNKWNKKIQNVFVDVEIHDGNHQVGSFRTKSVDIEAELIEKIRDFFDANGLAVGDYTFSLFVNYWDGVFLQRKEQSFPTSLVSSDEYGRLNPDKEVENLVGQASRTSGSEDDTYKILTWLLLGILLGALGFFVLWRFSHRDQYEGGEGGAL